MDRSIYESYLNILKKELVAALGCTEPIALAYAGAQARFYLKGEPERIDLYCSGNIIKNVKSVKIPNGHDLKGVEAACLLGMVGGNPDKELEVLCSATYEDYLRVKDLLNKKICTCYLKEGIPNLYIELFAYRENNKLQLIIEHKHTHISLIKLNEEIIYQNEASLVADNQDKETLNLKDIYTFAQEVNIADVASILQKQIDCNMTISQEGLISNWGANIGKLAMAEGEDLRFRCIARACAGSDARMGGCCLPVIINSGSGNQGMTCSLPVIEYALNSHKTKEELYRALCISNLIAQSQKRYIGALSAYCGVVCAAAGAGAGICYLEGWELEKIEQVVEYTILNVGGMLCDGAKPSCAAKIYTALKSAFLAIEMVKNDYHFQHEDGLCQDSAEATIKALGYVGRVGMKQTDVEILNIMLKQTDLNGGV